MQTEKQKEKKMLSFHWMEGKKKNRQKAWLNKMQKQKHKTKEKKNNPCKPLNMNGSDGLYSNTTVIPTL